MSDQVESKPSAGDVPENAQDLTIFVQNLLEQMVKPPLLLITYRHFSLVYSNKHNCVMRLLLILILTNLRAYTRKHNLYGYTLQQQRFNQMSTSIIGRIDEMGNRIDDLEKSISDLMQQARKSQQVICVIFLMSSCLPRLGQI